MRYRSDPRRHENIGPPGPRGDARRTSAKEATGMDVRRERLARYGASMTEDLDPLKTRCRPGGIGAFP